MSEDGIKVTDRRMFTEDGELREEYREQVEQPPAEPGPGARSEPPIREDPSLAELRPDASGGTSPHVDSPHLEPPHLESQYGDSQYGPGPDYQARDLGLMDLVALLAEPVPLFLGDAKLPGEQSVEDLERARLHIDLLQVLREKVQGNISRDEDAVLADLIYQLRMRYVQKHR